MLVREVQRAAGPCRGGGGGGDGVGMGMGVGMGVGISVGARVAGRSRSCSFSLSLSLVAPSLSPIVPREQGTRRLRRTESGRKGGCGILTEERRQ